MKWLERRWKSVVLCMTLCLFVCWVAGFWLNGLYGKQFDLASAWAGIGAIATSAGVGIAKFLGDSVWNSPRGQGKDENE